MKKTFKRQSKTLNSKSKKRTMKVMKGGSWKPGKLAPPVKNRFGSESGKNRFGSEPNQKSKSTQRAVQIPFDIKVLMQTGQQSKTFATAAIRRGDTYGASSHMKNVRTAIRDLKQATKTHPDKNLLRNHMSRILDNH